MDPRLAELLGEEDGDGPEGVKNEAPWSAPGFYPSPSYRDKERDLSRRVERASGDDVLNELANPRLPDQLWRHWARAANERGLIS